MSILTEPVLMLNKNWVPLDTCTVASSFSKIFSGTARFLDVEDYTLHGVESWLDLPVKAGMPALHTYRLEIRVPEILILRSGMAPRKKVMQFSRRNLMRRDRMTCQYCSGRPGAAHLTVDHIMPKKKGGKSSWANCVISCMKCNSKKADRVPDEAGMALRMRPEMKLLYPRAPRKWTEPYEPSWSPVFKVGAEGVRPSWMEFLAQKEVLAST